MVVAYQSNQRINLLMPGDILIADAGATVSHCGICVGLRHGHADYVIHATSKRGILKEDPSQWGILSQAFRANGTGLTKDELSAIENIAEKIMESAAYGSGRACFKSWSGTSSFGNGARERLTKYRNRLENHQGLVKNVYCSELVILSYQLGLGDENHRLFIKKDGKHTLPKTLRDYLRTNGNWNEIGDYKPA